MKRMWIFILTVILLPGIVLMTMLLDGVTALMGTVIFVIVLFFLGYLYRSNR